MAKRNGNGNGNGKPKNGGQDNAAEQGADQVPNGNGEGATGFALLDNQQIYDLVLNRISNEVELRLTQKSARRRTIMMGVIGVAGVLLASAATFFHETIVTRTANAAYEKNVGNLIAKVEIAALSLEGADLIRTLEENDYGFDRVQRDAVVDFFVRAAAVDGFAQRSNFLPQFEKTIDTLASAGTNTELDLLEGLYRDQSKRSPGIVVSLALHYGRRLLESPAAPDDWRQSSYADTMERFQIYSRVAKDDLFPEIYLGLQLLVEYVRVNDDAKGDDRVIDELVAQIDDLNPEDASNFWLLMRDFATGGFSISPTRETERIVERTIAFLCEHKGSNPGFKSILENDIDPVPQCPEPTA